VTQPKSSTSGEAPAPVNAGEGESPSRTSGDDVALICRVSEDRRSADILRRRGDQLELGTVRPLEEGKPISGEVVRLRPRPQAPFVCDVEVQFDGRPSQPSQLSGPPQVASERYRRGWDAIYKARTEPNTPSSDLN
jgi:hypothetical protein